jgi:hypothetical protein
MMKFLDPRVALAFLVHYFDYKRNNMSTDMEETRNLLGSSPATSRLLSSLVYNAFCNYGVITEKVNNDKQQGIVFSVDIREVILLP